MTEGDEKDASKRLIGSLEVVLSEDLATRAFA